MDSFIQIKELLNSKIEPFFKEEISFELEPPPIAISHTFVRGPTLTLEIPKYVVAVLCDPNRSFLDIGLEFERVEIRKGVLFHLIQGVDDILENLTLIKHLGRDETELRLSYELRLTITRTRECTNLEFTGTCFRQLFDCSELCESFVGGVRRTMDVIKEFNLSSRSTVIGGLENKITAVIAQKEQWPVTDRTVTLEPLIRVIGYARR